MSLRRRRLALQLAAQDLRLRSALQRAELLHSGRALRPSFELAERAAAGAREARLWAQAHPGLAAAAGVAVALCLRPRRVAGWAGTLLGAWSLWRRVQPLIIPRAADGAGRR